MQMRAILILILVGLFTACTPTTLTPELHPEPIEAVTPFVASATPESTPTPVEESNPSYKVAAFYYPWYGNPEIDGKWIHWTQNNHLPPADIAADYYPALGAYSSNDPAVVAQHMEWLQRAKVGVIIISWWGQGSREDQSIPLLLQTAERYGIKVAFHIEPYSGRTAQSLVSDIQYLYQQYGDSPAFFRSAEASRYSPESQPKGMFFLWSIAGNGDEKYSYWQQATDQIHALPEGALVIAHTTDAGWIEGSHFDGLYNYATLHLEENDGFDWAHSLPLDALYIPSVIPGFSARRVGYAENTFVPREEGATFSKQWDTALKTGVKPTMVTITSFNEWHEGSVIEPARFGMDNGAGYTYADFGTLPPEGYLNLTRAWVDKYLAMSWPSAYRARIKISTTSDWTTLDLVGAGMSVRPERILASPSATTAGVEQGDRFVLTQSLADASAGNQVEVTWDVLLTGLSPDQQLILQLGRGNIGKTQVTIWNYNGSTPVEVHTAEWDQTTGDGNRYEIVIPAKMLTDPNI